MRISFNKWVIAGAFGLIACMQSNTTRAQTIQIVTPTLHAVIARASLCTELGLAVSNCEVSELAPNIWVVATGESLLYVDETGVAELVVHDRDGGLHSVAATELKPQSQPTPSCPQAPIVLIGTQSGQVYELCGQRLRPLADAADFADLQVATPQSSLSSDKKSQHGSRT